MPTLGMGGRIDQVSWMCMASISTLAWVGELKSSARVVYDWLLKRYPIPKMG